jgi:hypothetical protein
MRSSHVHPFADHARRLRALALGYARTQINKNRHISSHLPVLSTEDSALSIEGATLSESCTHTTRSQIWDDGETVKSQHGACPEFQRCSVGESIEKAPEINGLLGSGMDSQRPKHHIKKPSRYSQLPPSVPLKSQKPAILEVRRPQKQSKLNRPLKDLESLPSRQRSIPLYTPSLGYIEYKAGLGVYKALSELSTFLQLFSAYVAPVIYLSFICVRRPL